MNVFADTWAYLTDPASWSGSGGMLELLVQQLLLSLTALVVALAIGLPVALWLGPLRLKTLDGLWIVLSSAYLILLNLH